MRIVIKSPIEIVISESKDRPLVDGLLSGFMACVVPELLMKLMDNAAKESKGHDEAPQAVADEPRGQGDATNR